MPGVFDRWLLRASNICPDKKACRPLAVLPMLEGFMCVGRLAVPTDHVTPKVNDLQLCVNLDRRGPQWWKRWHINEDDIVAFMDLLVRALEATDKERKDALHTGNAEEGGRPGD